MELTETKKRDKQLYHEKVTNQEGEDLKQIYGKSCFNEFHEKSVLKYNNKAFSLQGRLSNITDDDDSM